MFDLYFFFHSVQCEILLIFMGIYFHLNFIFISVFFSQVQVQNQTPCHLQMKMLALLSKEQIELILRYPVWTTKMEVRVACFF